MAIQTALRDLPELSRYHAAVRPEKVAMTFEGRETTFGQLDRRANRVANGLHAACSATQTRVAVLDKNSDQYFELLFGAAKSRNVLVPVNWRLAPSEIAYIVNDAEAEILFVGQDYVETIERLRSELRTVQQIVALRGDHPTWEAYTAWRDRQSVADPKLETQGDDVVLQLYTSGTTGHPKGVQLTQDVAMSTLVGGREYYPCTADDISLSSMPQFHWTGTFVGLFALHEGARTVIDREFDAHEILRLIPAERVTRMNLVPAAILPEATAASQRDGWFHTGDAGYFDEDGYLYLFDRVKDMIVSGGENVYTAEVESALFGHPAIADIAVIGVPDDRWGETVKAVVVRKPDVQVEEAELIAYARERVAHYKAPKSVDFVEELRRNPSGKILKRVLRAPYWEGYERQIN